MAYLKRAGMRGNGAMAALSVALPLLVAACGSDDGTTGTSGSGGSRGGAGGSTGGSGGSTGGTGGVDAGAGGSTGGTGGATGGTGGSTGGTGGATGGTGGSTGGAAGKGGTAGTGGSTGGTAGTGGAAGAKDGGTTGGTGGVTDGGGTGGAAGTGGAGGSTTDGGAGTGGTGGTGGGTDGGVVVVVPPGDPISVPDMTWKAVPTDGAICRDKSATGFGVNFNAASDKLIIFMEGGGACFNGTTCGTNPRAWAATDANLTGTGTGATNVNAKFVMNRSAAGNPFKDWNMAYIPYCTGDVHTGTNMAGFNGDAHMGYSNYLKYLGKLVATFKAKMPALTQVVLSGSSAGGFGVAWNWMVTEDAFGVPVTAIDDSGPPFASDWLSTCHQQRTGMLWGWSGSVHPTCTNCDVAGGNTVVPLMEAAMRRQKTRFGFISYDEDGTIKNFLAFGQNNCANWDAFLPPAFATGKFPMGLADLRTRWMSNPNAAMFVIKGGSHTVLASNLANFTTAGTTLLDWTNKMLSGDSTWTNVVP